LRKIEIKRIKSKVILPLIIALLIAFVAIYSFLIYSNEKNIIDSSVVYAKNNIQQYLSLRKYYTQRVVGLIKEKSDLKVDILLDNKQNSIPLPATMIHELSELFKSQNSYIQLNLYSNYPFPNRLKRILDDFEKESLTFLVNNPNKIFFRREVVNNKDSVRVAVADTFSDKTCVNCHNSLPSSPKKNWKLHDMRGALEIILPIDTIMTENKNNTIQLTFVFVIVFTLLVSWIVNIILQLNKTNRYFGQLIRNLDLHKAALDSHAIVSILDDKGNISYVNDKFCEISGYTKDELIGKEHTFSESLDEGIINELRWKSIKKGDIWEGEVKNINKKGEVFWVLMSILPILDQSDRKNQYISIKTDITKIKDIEDELNHAKIDAEKASQVKSQFLANMSHEIRTPLNAILGFSDVLANIELDKKNKEYAQIISNSAESLLKIINDILDISKIESGKFQLNYESLNIHTFIDQIVELFSVKTKEKNIRFVYHMESKIPFIIKSDSTKLRQVLSNLLTNAIKFTPQNGRIDFNIKLVEINNNIAKIMFLIKDTGIGISKEQKELIFKPFQQADEKISKKFGGTGLGLAISNDIVKLMNSEIFINSNIGKGSEFLLTLDLEILQLENEKHPILRDLTFVLCHAQNGEYLDASLSVYLKEIGKVLSIDDEDCEYADMLFCFSSQDFEKIDRFKSLNQKLFVVYAGDENNLNFKDILKIDYFVDLPIYQSKISNLIFDAFNLYNKTTAQSNENEKLDVNILLAEDNINNQKLMCVLLSKIGARCTIAEDGFEAIKLYRDNIFDLVLMDINMPHLDGLEATQRILESQKSDNLYKVPIIALTANSIAGDKENYLNHGMDDYLSKPVKYNELYYMIEKHTYDINKKPLKKDLIIEPPKHDEQNNTATYLYKKNDAIKQLGLDEDTIDMLIEDFFLTLDEDIEKIQKAIDSKIATEIQNSAHYLKSSCLNLAMNEAASVLQDIENRAKNGETESFDTLNLKLIFEKIKKLV